MTTPPSPASTPDVSVVIPVCNEDENVLPLAQEIHAALAGKYSFEQIFVDDGSTDRTGEMVLAARAQGMPEIRLLQHVTRSGQSAAVATGVRHARGRWIATLDGDGQNDPADFPRLLDALMHPASPKLKLVMGNRTTRRDTWLRRVSSRVANGVRGWFLKDGTPDTGCGIKVFDRDVFMHMPRFKNMHRFMPALFQREGLRGHLAARESSRAHARHVQVRPQQPALGRHRRPVGPELADPPRVAARRDPRGTLSVTGTGGASTSLLDRWLRPGANSPRDVDGRPALARSGSRCC